MDIDHAVNQVRAAAARVDESLEAVAAAKHALHRAALKALITVDADDGRSHALIRRLYWDVPEVPVKTLEAVVGSGAAVRRLAGSGPPIGDCELCGDEVRATSRSQLTIGVARCRPCAREHQNPWPSTPASSWYDDVPYPESLPEWDERMDVPDR